MRVIELDTAETFYSLRHRLLNGGRDRVVLVVPGRGAALRGGVDLPLLRRLADRERLEVGLVTADRELARQARAVGLPTFSSVTLAEHYRPGWWRARRRAERLGFPPGPVPDHPNVEASLIRSRRLLQALGLLMALVLISAIPLAAALYFLPAASIALRPASQPAQAIIELTADPALTAADPANQAIPARPVTLSLAWEATGPGTNAAARQQVRALALQALNAGAATGWRRGAGQRPCPARRAADRLAARLAPGQWPRARGDASGGQRGGVHRHRRGATRLALQAELTGLAVAAADVHALVFPALARALPDGYALDPATLTTDLEAGSAPIGCWPRRPSHRAGDDSTPPPWLRNWPGTAREATGPPASSTPCPCAEPSRPRLDIRPWPAWRVGLFARLRPPARPHHGRCSAMKQEAADFLGKNRHNPRLSPL